MLPEVKEKPMNRAGMLNIFQTEMKYNIAKNKLNV